MTLPGNPQITVMMTVFNGLPYIEQAVASVLAQDHPSFELLVVDDGSTDGTGDFLAAIDDPRVRVLSRPHEGRVAALNTAVGAARGIYLANLDADDLALPGRLALSCDFLEKNPQVGAVGSATQQYAVEGATTPRPPRRLPRTDRAIRWWFLIRNPMFHSSVTYRTSAVRELGGFDPAYNTMDDDADMLLRIAARHRLTNLPVPLSVRRLHRGQHFASAPARERARLHASCRLRAARELSYPRALRPFAYTIALLAAGRSYVQIGLLGRNGRLDHRATVGAST